MATFEGPGVLAIAQTIMPNSFEERMATDVAVCASTGKSVSISYHTFGSTENPMLLLIPGLGCQGLSLFDTAMCTWLAQQGFYVVRMDNRDVGLSTKFDDVPQRIAVPVLMLPNWMAFGERIPYTLNDMADDAAALIRKLLPSGQTAAHIVGASMGGMISQLLGLRYPELVRSLTLVMTNSGNPRVGKTPTSTLLGLLRKPASRAPADLIAHNDWVFSEFLIGVKPSTRFLADLIMKEYGRSGFIDSSRQMAAIQRAPCRDEALRAGALKGIPVHVVHGGMDRLLPVACGRHLASLIEGSELTVFPYMGHVVDDGHAQLFGEAVVTFIKKHAP